jgi:photosystem II stability/assembly factor-like uncharacterized protein
VWRHAAWSVLVAALFTLSACIEAADEEVLRELNEMGASRGNVFPDREDYYDAFVLDANNAWVSGGRGLILHVTNNGQDFAMLETGVQKAIYEVDFATAEDGVAVGQDGIVLKTGDGGKTWNRIPIELPLLDWQVAQPHYFAVSRGADAQHLWAVGPVGAIIRSQDGGETWENLSLWCDMSFDNFATSDPADDPESTLRLNPCDVTLNGVSFPTNTDGWVAGEFGIILRTQDGGVTWQRQRNVHNLPKYTRPELPEEEAIRQRIPPLYIEDLFLIDVDFRSAQEGYVTGESGTLLQTTDAGETWTNIPSGSFNTLLSVTAAPDDNRSDFATGVLGTLASATSDAWQLDENIRQDVLTWIRTASFAPDGQFGVACGGKGTVLVTTDSGKSWTTTDKAKLYAANPSL